MGSERAEYFVMVDVGGASAKSALLSSVGKVVKGSFSNTPIDSQGTSEQIIGTLVSVLRGKWPRSRASAVIKGIGLCFPGPFDYRQGVSLMKHKFPSIYGVNLRSELSSKLGLPQGFPIVLEEDSVAFLKGEAWVGNASGYSRVIGLTLGTGLGAAFMVNGKIARTGPGIPRDGELWCLPSDHGTMEDYVSSRGLRRIYQDITGCSGADVEAIACNAESGDADSIRAFKEFGRTMGRLLCPHAERFRPGCMVVGGQMAKSFDRFGPFLQDELLGVPSLENVTRARHIDCAPFFGLFLAMRGDSIDCR